ncbi:MAG: hypothetical protein HQ536_02605 [Parcubacteria group bacterium]|nr:hypothetical protein [Parcubacteria group bacterium]
MAEKTPKQKYSLKTPHQNCEPLVIDPSEVGGKEQKIDELAFTIRFKGERLKNFEKLKQEIQIASHSVPIHRAIELALRFLELRRKAKPMYNIPRELIEDFKNGKNHD